MRAIRFLPLAFLAGIDGFDLFAPYAAGVLAVVPLIRLATRTRAARDVQTHDAAADCPAEPAAPIPH